MTMVTVTTVIGAQHADAKYIATVRAEGQSGSAELIGIKAALDRNYDRTHRSEPIDADEPPNFPEGGLPQLSGQVRDTYLRKASAPKKGQ